MKKLIIIVSIFLSLVYLSSAVNIVLTSWTKLDNSSWDNLSSVLNKVNINWDNININWKLVVDWKICDASNNCLWICNDWKIWDTNTNSCIISATTPETAWETCWKIKQWNSTAPDGYYYITLPWHSSPTEVYCDMTTEWGGLDSYC